MVSGETGLQDGREPVGVRATTKRIRIMRRMLWVALLAAPVALASAEPAQAQGCASCGTGGIGGGGAPFARAGFQVPPFGCPFGFCFRLFPGMHQHGPLVNYGPYSGYYPFEPYGPWTSNLRYTGPTGPQTANDTGWAPRLAGLFHHGYLRRGADDCASCGSHGRYALTTLQNVKSRLHPSHRFGCGTGCGK
jgi:hypothetical protein